VKVGLATARQLTQSAFLSIRASVGFDRQDCVLEAFGGKVFRRDPILKRSHFPDSPVERCIRPELQQQQMLPKKFRNAK
jgi:hypothetical protein